MNWNEQEKKWEEPKVVMEDTETQKEKSIEAQSGFFTKIAEMLNESTTLTMKIGKTKSGLIVSVLPNSLSKDEALKKLAPVVIKGTIEELNAQFFDALKPVKSFAEFSADATSFEKAVEKAKEESEIAKKQKEEKKKLKEKVDKLIEEANAAHEKKDAEEMRKIINKIAGADPKNKAIEELNKKITEIAGDTLF